VKLFISLFHLDLAGNFDISLVSISKMFSIQQKFTLKAMSEFSIAISMINLSSLSVPYSSLGGIFHYL